MARKVFISVLGAGRYSECRYAKDGFTSEPMRFIQEATLQMLQSQGSWGSDDAAYILLTDGASKANWTDDSASETVGLRTRLEAMGLPFAVNTVEHLPLGNNEAEIWEIFTRTYEQLQCGDTLYIDVTHGFRYLPMLVVSLVNYSRFLKNTNVACITYGNFESRDKSTNIAPIIDLTSLSALLEWNYAAGQFVDNGDIVPLQKLSKAVIAPIMRNAETRRSEVGELDKYLSSLTRFIEALRNCRGKDVISCADLSAAQKSFEKMEKDFIAPLVPLFDRIAASLLPFTAANSLNAIIAARWCFDRSMYQQAATFLREGVVTMLCEHYGFDFNARKQREIVENVLYIVKENVCEEEWRVDDCAKVKVKEIIADGSISKDIADKYHALGEIRNDFNHSGMREKALSPDRLKKNIAVALEAFETVFLHSADERPTMSDVTRRVLLNISNHPSSTWNEEQMAAAASFGEIVDVPFPVIDETAESSDVQALADEYLVKVRALADGCQATIHIMGEQTFLYSMLYRLQHDGYRCIASTTKRIVDVMPDGSRKVTFCFSRFREYENLAF